ncbi:MAG: cell wall metabolism sensor histidine kinase WalK [Lachnospiraceae bacterium]|nr:cell wall metabolism sensor histidine kinase WalK [Lachnospiraceae bacterium]
MKHSIRRQITTLFIIVITFTVLLCFLANFLFLKSYYLINRRNIVVDMYMELLETSLDSKFNDASFVESIQNECERNNISVVVVSKYNSVIASAGNETVIITDEISHMIASDNYKFDEKHPYILNSVRGKLIKREFIQMFGILPNNEYFIIRCPVEDVKDSVSIANTFLFQIGLLSILVGIIATILISRRITKPIVELSIISSQMANLDFSTKYSGSNGNEMDILGENFNDMSDKLEMAISELKTANANLIQDIKKKEEIEEMRKEFTSNVSHELKTPIALIQSYAEGLKEGIMDDEESRNYYLDVIIDESNRMNHLVKQLMSLYELESGKNDLQIEHVDISELIKNHINTNELMFKQNDIKVEFLNNDESIYVWTDEYKTSQIIQNYISNAIHYCEGEKLIRIEIKKFDEVARINIFNTGKHISSEDMPHIWEKFYKADKARSRDYGGSGIGLSLTKAICESFNMKYGCENVDSGVNFYFELPFK